MKGFTLVETLVAVAILSIAIMAPLYEASRGIIAAQNSSYQLTASYLAQEGIEFVRMMRDNDYLAKFQADSSTATSAGWTQFLADINKCEKNNSTTNICTLDPSLYPAASAPTALVPCVPASSNCSGKNLYLQANGLYTQSSASGTKQPYIRTIQTIPVTSSDEKVVSTVMWFFHGTTYTVTSVVHLTPWE